MKCIVFLTNILISFLIIPLFPQPPLPKDTTMDKAERRARQKLAGMAQEQVFTYWSELDEPYRKLLIEQIDRLDATALRLQQEALQKKEDNSRGSIEAFQNIVDSTNVSEDLGMECLSKGKVGCIIVAGGQGTRLKIEGAKGKYPISVVKNKTLFQIFAEKTLAAGRQAGKMLQLAIMTSPQNHQETVQFFLDNNYFGLSSLQISFFSQGTLPLLDLRGNLFLEEKHVISEGADGNGSCLKSFVESGIWEKWKKAGIEQINFILIDNPLADPYDAKLISLHRSQQNDVTIKCVVRQDPNEKVGVVVSKNGSVEIIEYSEMSDVEKRAVNLDGTLKHQCANISLYCLDMDFVQEAAARADEMALHPAFKAVKAVDEEGHSAVSKEPNAWKFERFIFDILPMADKISAILYDREDCFAPLKNYEGSDSPATVRQALQEIDKKIWKRVTGRSPPSHSFELSQDFHYPTASFRKKWEGALFSDLTYYDAAVQPIMGEQ